MGQLRHPRVDLQWKNVAGERGAARKRCRAARAIGPRTSQTNKGSSRPYVEDSIPITTDELDGTVRWKDGAELGAWAGKPIRLHFHVKNARVYGFQFL